MAERKSVSMQESTTGAVNQFLEYEGCECIQSIKLITYLSGALQRYEEEGVVLSPSVLLCNSITKFTAAIPGGRYVVVGKDMFTPETGRRILKHCATLARSGWTIFVERNPTGTKITFGVFSFLASPTSVSLRAMVSLEVDVSIGEPDFAVLAERIDPKTVLLTGSKGNSLKIALSTTRNIETEGDPLGDFTNLCVKTKDDSDFQLYLKALITRTLNESHGTILVNRTDAITKVKGMKDAVVLDPPLDLFASFAAYKAEGTGSAILELQRSEALLVGMLQSDGITVFDEKGTVTAYRVFFREQASSKNGGAKGSRLGSAPIGGARRRAYEGLKELVGIDLQGVLFRSQDGLTEFHGV